MNTIHRPSDCNSLDEIMQSAGTKLVVIDFGATWCPPCRKIKPFFESLPSKYPDVVFISVDVDQLREHPLLSDISSVPTFKFFINTSLISQFSGAMEYQLTSKIEQLRPKLTIE